MVRGANSTSLFYLNLPGAGGDWTFNQLTLTQSPNWRLDGFLSAPAPTTQQVALTLSNVTSIGILADWVSRFAGHPLGDFGPDITGLDAVRLYIPEPSTALLLLAGFGAFALIRRRRVA